MANRIRYQSVSTKISSIRYNTARDFWGVALFTFNFTSLVGILILCNLLIILHMYAQQFISLRV